MGDPAWCELCKAPATTPAIPRVLPGDDVDVVRIGDAVARREGGWRPTVVRLQNSHATTGTELSRWALTLQEPSHVFDLEFYRAPDLVMEIQLRFRHGPERFMGLHRRHRLGVTRHSKGWWSSLRNQSIYSAAQPDRCGKRVPTLEQLSSGARIPDAADEIAAYGGVVVPRSGLGATKRASSTFAILGATDVQAPHIAVFLVSRVLPVYYEYAG